MSLLYVSNYEAFVLWYFVVFVVFNFFLHVLMKQALDRCNEFGVFPIGVVLKCLMIGDLSILPFITSCTCPLCCLSPC